MANGSWQAARHRTVIGAAHRRQARPCQDASLVAALNDAAGRPLQLLLVADGHGGSRYHLSAVGSRLACQVAVAAVEAALRTTALTDQTAWRQQLVTGLPMAIQRRWLAAIESDWEQRAAGPAPVFSPLSYGTTLGLALLAPDWWGCTGLGDWDLVRVSEQRAELVSQEGERGGPGEATASLCLTEAEALWAERSRLEAIHSPANRFGLLLSTDGVRKSCATDADFLQLSQHLLALRDPQELERGLIEISAAGSGDDLSVAMAAWSGAAGGPPAASRRAGGARPSLIAAAALGLGALVLALALLPPGRQLRQLAWRRPPPAGSEAATAIATATPSQRIRAEAGRLCRSPQLIAGSLAQRKTLFARLGRERQQAQQLQAAAALDPLSGLIAASLPRTQARRALEPSLCPALRQALDQRWQHQQQAHGSP